MGGAYESFGTHVISFEGKSILCQNVKMYIWRGSSIPWSHHTPKRSQGRPEQNHGNRVMAYTQKHIQVKRISRIGRILLKICQELCSFNHPPNKSP